MACGIGYDNFVELPDGAFAMDEIFETADFESNIPVIRLTGASGDNFTVPKPKPFCCTFNTYRFAAYFQWNMESNGKYVDRNGKKVTYQTGLNFGRAGNQRQHAFLPAHSPGTKMIPCDFMAPAISHNPISDHQKLLANFCANRSLMLGKLLHRLKPN
ncbi:MAG: hypothetical protein U0Z17_01270 [Bacteroidales bacterium]